MECTEKQYEMEPVDVLIRFGRQRSNVNITRGQYKSEWEMEMLCQRRHLPVACCQLSGFKWNNDLVLGQLYCYTVNGHGSTLHKG